MARNPKVDKSFSNSKLWRQEADELREILLECGLTEESKWRSQQGPNSRAGFLMRFSSVQDVARMAKSIKAFILPPCPTDQ